MVNRALEQSTLLMPAAKALQRAAVTAPVTLTIAMGAVFASSGYYLRIPMLVYDRSRMIQVAFLVAGALVLVSSRPRGQVRLGVSWERPLLGALGIAALASVAFAGVLDIAIREAALLGLLAVLTVAVAHEARRDDARTVRGGIIAFAIVAGFTTMVLALISPDEVRHAADQIWAHPRFLGQASTWVLPLLVAAAVRSSGRARLGCWSLAAVWATLSSFSATRGSWVGIAVALLLAVALDRRNRRTWLVVWSSVLLIGGPLGVLLNMQIGTVRSVERMVASPGTGRSRIWAHAVDLWLERPLFGVGPAGMAVTGEPPAHPHNAPLQLLAEWGVVPTALLLVVIAVAIVRSIQQWPRGGEREQTAWRTGLVASAVAAGVHSLVSGIIVMPISQLLLVLVLGGLVGVSPLAREPDTQRRPAARAVAVPLLAILLVVSAIITKPEIVEVGGTFPRFWAGEIQGFLPFGS